uniref:BTB domain-containing protein n=1 Tax=Panagrolaimus superbus TaxID=310955 RepID=A0A914YFZ7_9BILA
MRNSSMLWEQYSLQRDKLIINLRTKLLTNMSSLIGHAETSDLLLVAADGKKLPAHICILRQRAPIFFEKHISPTLDARTPRQRRIGEPLEVAIGDVDSAGLSFFIKSVYTDEEIQNLENENTIKDSTSDQKRDDENPDSSNFDIDHEFDDSQHYANEEEEEEGGREGETPRQDCDSLDRTPGAYQKELDKSEEIIYSVPIPREHDSGFHQPSSIEKPPPSTTATTTTSIITISEEPIMTSFRELANDSPMCLSGYSERSQYDIVEEEAEHEISEEASQNSSHFGSHGRFYHLEDSGIVSSQIESPKKKKSTTKIFPMFIGFGSGDSEMTQSMPSSTLSSSPYSSTNTLSAGSIRGRAMLARRLSVTSLTSLTSIDLTPTTENVTPIGDKLPCSTLGGDLLEMYQKSLDTDTIIVTDGGDLHAHKCILWATCPTFRKILKSSTKIELRGFSRNAIDFLLSFLYGGLTNIPEEVEVWEVIALATHLNLEELAQVAALHLKAHKCHFFHRPCATCVSAVFDALPQFRTIKCLNGLYDEAMSWQARHFSRIWKGRVFLHLDEQWQHGCRDALINEIDEELLIDTLLGCEKLQASLSRTKSQQLAESVLSLVNDVIEYCTEFLISSFDLILGSTAFKNHGKGLALNLALLEDLFPPLIHSLSADTAIRAFITLRDLLIEIQQNEEDLQLQQSPNRRRSFLHIPIHDWNPVN